MVPMTADEEDLLAEGKNYEHSSGAIGSCSLEILFRAYKCIDTAIATFEQQGELMVFHVNLYFYLSVLMNYCQPSQGKLRNFIEARSPSMCVEFNQRSNFSRYDSLIVLRYKIIHFFLVIIECSSP